MIVDRAADVLDFGQPVAVMLLGVLHLTADAEDPADVISAYGAVGRKLRDLAFGDRKDALAVRTMSGVLDNRQRQLKTDRLHRAMPIMVACRSHPVTCGRVVHKLVDNPSYVRITARILWISCGLRKGRK